MNRNDCITTRNYCNSVASFWAHGSSDVFTWNFALAVCCLCQRTFWIWLTVTFRFHFVSRCLQHQMQLYDKATWQWWLNFLLTVRKQQARILAGYCPDHPGFDGTRTQYKTWHKTKIIILSSMSPFNSLLPCMFMLLERIFPFPPWPPNLGLPTTWSASTCPQLIGFNIRSCEANSLIISRTRSRPASGSDKRPAPQYCRLRHQPQIMLQCVKAHNAKINMSGFTVSWGPERGCTQYTRCDAGTNCFLRPPHDPPRMARQGLPHKVELRF